MAFLYLFACHVAVPINLTAVDIGRHLKNGALIVSGQSDVLYRNFYSFTYPDYSFINHHWLSGVIFYGVHTLVGWEGLELFFILILLSAFFFFYKTARHHAPFGIVMLLSVIALNIMTDRKEIRPEGLSLLFFGIYFYVLSCVSTGRLKVSRALKILIPVQILWVNCHIFFFLGPLLAVCYLIHQRRYWPMIGIVSFVNVINPSGFAGALTPLNGFKDFGYSLAENQTVLFMLKRFTQDATYKYELVLLVLGVCALIWWMKHTWRQQWLLGLFFIIVFLAGFKAVRLMAPSAFVWIIVGSLAIGQRQKLSVGAGALATVLIAFGLFGNVPFLTSKTGSTLTLGLAPQVNASADFFKSTHLQGPLFSNYDIGGFLIYHLFPKEKVFVDNRQEAFPPKFFKNTYIPMQEEESRWKELSNQYKFEVVFFYRHDLTPWGQAFLIRLIDDPQWAPIFVDGYTIIFSKRGGHNQNVIDRFELPRTMFGVARK